PGAVSRSTLGPPAPRSAARLATATSARGFVVTGAGLAGRGVGPGRGGEAADQPRHPAQRADGSDQRLGLAITEVRDFLEVSHVAERDGEAVVEIVDQLRRGIGAARQQALGVFPGPPGLDEGLLAARGRD